MNKDPLQRKDVRFSAEEFRRIQELNVDALFRLSRVAHSYLKTAKNAGRIVNVSSMAAHLGFTGVVPYCASKAAVKAIREQLPNTFLNIRLDPSSW